MKRLSKANDLAQKVEMTLHLPTNRALSARFPMEQLTERSNVTLLTQPENNNVARP